MRTYIYSMALALLSFSSYAQAEPVSKTQLKEAEAMASRGLDEVQLLKSAQELLNQSCSRPAIKVQACLTKNIKSAHDLLFVLGDSDSRLQAHVEKLRKAQDRLSSASMLESAKIIGTLQKQNEELLASKKQDAKFYTKTYLTLSLEAIVEKSDSQSSIHKPVDVTTPPAMNEPLAQKDNTKDDQEISKKQLEQQVGSLEKSCYVDNNPNSYDLECLLDKTTQIGTHFVDASQSLGADWEKFYDEQIGELKERLVNDINLGITHVGVNRYEGRLRKIQQSVIKIRSQEKSPSRAAVRGSSSGAH